jgi:hypothetical protein
MKKNFLFFGFFIFIFLVFFIAPLILSDNFDDINEKKEEITENLENTKESIESAKSYTEKERLDYLSKEWKEFFLKNKFVVFLDNFFKEINIIFIILFGQNYEFSLILFIVIFLWFFFLINFNVIFRDYSNFTSYNSIIISFGLVIIFSQINLFNKFSNIIFNILFFKEGIWRLFSFLFFFLTIIFIFTFIKSLGYSIKKNREKNLEEEYKIKRESSIIRMRTLERFTDSIVRAFS